MHVHFEEHGSTRSDCPVQALSWMGKVPETQPDEDGWKLNQLHYYQEGWLASGNTRGIIGVTFTACHCRKNFEQPPRTNFNLRGHRNEVALVKWNEPYQKLATCDVTGVIFVWIKHEGRWSIELINDRNSQVTDFAWSHDGRMALICYRDGFVLVGSVAGQRYWSSMLNLDGCTITCGIWSPDDQKVFFGTTDGQVIVMSSNGAMLAQVTLMDGVEMTSMAWSCQKFYLDERDTTDTDNTNPHAGKHYTLAVCFKNGSIYLMSNYDDLCPRVIHSTLTGVKMEWCNDGEVLAVAGFVRLPNLECSNDLRFYTAEGYLRYTLPVPHQGKPVSALTWGHNNKRLFVAVGCHIYTAWVTKKVALLQYLCRRAIQHRLKDDNMAAKLPLPTKLRASITALFSPTIKGYIPDPHRLREFVCMPPPGVERLHCTMIRHGEETSGGHYMLYLEYLGGLIPLLKGKRASKIRPEFVIFDPKIKTGTKADEEDIFISSDSGSSGTDSDQDVVVEGCGSPRMQRKKRLKKLRQRMERRDSTASQRPLDELLYDDNLPETHKLVEVTSNLWGTKFKLHGLASFLPEDLGQVLYKTSLLHLQPRQMTVSILELTPELQPHARDPTYNPNQFSESDDELANQQMFQDHSTDGAISTSVDAIPVSPETYNSQLPKLTNQSSTETLNNNNTLENGAIEVPVIIERHSLFQTSKGEKCTSNCSPFEIRSLDGSPPQRRSPSLKSRSLSPAEQQVTYTSNTLMESSVDGDMFTREMYIDKSGIQKIRMNSTYQLTAEVAESEAEPIEVQAPASPRSVVQLAAKRLEDVLAVQLLNCDTGGQHLSSSGSDPGMSYRRKSSNSSSDNGVGYLHQSSNSSDGSTPPIESTTVHLEPPSRMSGGSTQPRPPPRWADKACQEIKYIDDDLDDTGDGRKESKEAVFCSAEGMSAREIMASTQMLAELDRTSGGGHSDSFCTGLPPLSGTLAMTTNSIELHKKRLVLAPPPHQKEQKGRKSLRTRFYSELQNARNSLELIHRGERHQSGASYTDDSLSSSRSDSPKASRPTSPVLCERHRYEIRRCSLETKTICARRDSSTELTDRTSKQSASLPTSPVRRVAMPQQKRARSKQDISVTKQKMQSPLLRRRLKNYKAVDSSDEEMLLSGDDVTTSENYKNLETFQKAQLSKKLRKVRTKNDDSRDHVRRSPSMPRKRHFVMHNKAPLWNENSQVYQLDFGGRVTQESAKNFQIEFRGKQVMQFGRIDGNAYTLDFQYPFSAIQAFAVALANVTQRLK